MPTRSNAAQPAGVVHFGGLYSCCEPFRSLLRRLPLVARSSASVLIEGEPGTGKELMARALHEHSRRAAREMVALNCGGMSRDLVASTLFGHVRGAFTGADRARSGAVRRANGSTLFLDEIGELPLSDQTLLLRVLQELRRSMKRLQITAPSTVGRPRWCACGPDRDEP